MHLSKQLAAKLSAALVALTTVIVPSMAADVGTVTSDTGLNLRSEASTDAAVLATLDHGTQVDVLSTSDDGTWHKVTYNGMTGYMSGDYLQVTEEQLYGQVMDGPLNIRSGPGTEYGTVGSLSTGAIVEIEELVGGYGGWYKIEQGYVSSDYVAQVDASVAASSGKGSQIAQYALQYVGCPYVYGGSSPSGFDCSGFTTYVMKHFGYSINQALRLLHQPHRLQPDGQRHLRLQEPAAARRSGVLQQRQLQQARHPRGHLHRQRPVCPRLHLHHRRDYQRPEQQLLQQHLCGRPPSVMCIVLF